METSAQSVPTCSRRRKVRPGRIGPGGRLEIGLRAASRRRAKFIELGPVDGAVLLALEAREAAEAAGAEGGESKRPDGAGAAAQCADRKQRRSLGEAPAPVREKPRGGERALAAVAVDEGARRPDPERALQDPAGVGARARYPLEDERLVRPHDRVSSPGEAAEELHVAPAGERHALVEERVELREGPRAHEHVVREGLGEARARGVAGPVEEAAALDPARNVVLEDGLAGARHGV